MRVQLRDQDFALNDIHKRRVSAGSWIAASVAYWPAEVSRALWAAPQEVERTRRASGIRTP